MSKQKVSKVAKDVMEKYGQKSICIGDLGMLSEIYSICKLKIKIQHPLNRNQAVINALDYESKQEDSIFAKEYIRLNRLCRLFTLKDE